MPDSYLWEMIQTAVRIMELDQLDSELTDTPEWKAAKAEYEAQQEQFNTLRGDYVDRLLAEEGTRDNAVADVQGQLTDLREQADPSWYPAIDYTSDNLLPYLTKEASRSPHVRRARKAAPFVAAALVVIIYFGVRLFSGVSVTADLLTREGLQQRAAATEKAIRYDEWMGTRVRRGGWLKGLLFWPIKPTDAEINGAAEFAGIVLEGAKYVEGCGSLVSDHDSLTDEQIDAIRDVASYIQRDNVNWEEPPLVIIAGLERSDAC